MKFFVGAVREPPLRVDSYAKACGYQISGRFWYFNPNPDSLAENFPFDRPLLQMEAPIFPKAPEIHARPPGKKAKKPHALGYTEFGLK
jgi:hypothetical protein